MTYVVDSNTKIALNIKRRVKPSEYMWYEWKYTVFRGEDIERSSDWFNEGGLHYKVLY